MKRIYTLLAATLTATAMAAQTRYVLFGTEGKDQKAIATETIGEIAFADDAATITKKDGTALSGPMAWMTTPALSVTENDNVELVDSAKYNYFMMTSGSGTGRLAYKVHLTPGWNEDTYADDPCCLTVRLWKTTTLETSSGTEKRFWVLTYNEEHTRVESIKQLLITQDEENWQEVWNTEHEYIFSYNDEGRLTGVRDGKNDVVKDVTYSNGLLDTYSVLQSDSTTFKEYKTKYAVINNELLRIDCMDTGDDFTIAGKMLPNPLYIEGLPAVIPGFVSDIPLYFLYNKYMYNGTTGTPVTWAEGSYKVNILSSTPAWTASFTRNNVKYNAYFINQ